MSRWKGKDISIPTPPKKCVACNGSGRYDVKNSPKCGSCNGTGLQQQRK